LALAATPIDLVISDYKMPQASGLDLVRHVRENLKDTEVVMITGYASIEGAIEAIKTGAEEYLSKPFTDEELFEAVRRAWRSAAVAGLPLPLAATASPLPGFIGESEAMQQVYAAIRKAAETTATVLVTGESGRQRAGGPRHSLQQPPLRRPVRGRQLQGHPRRVDRERNLRPYEGRSPGRDLAGGILPDRRWRDHLPGRDQRAEPAPQVKFLRVLQDKAVTMVGALHPGTWMSASSRPPTRISAPWWSGRFSGKTSSFD
jgi:CheY-like chemotaxis protein